MRDKNMRNIYYDCTNRIYKIQFGVGGKNVTVGRAHTIEEARKIRDAWVEKNGWRHPGRSVEVEENLGLSVGDARRV